MVNNSLFLNNLKHNTMKNSILFAILFLSAISIFAQTPAMFTVKDTTFIQDPRLEYMKNTILPAAANFVDDYNRNQKVAGNPVLLKQETSQFIRKMEKLVADYSLGFMEVKDLQIDSVSVVNEFNALNIRINELQNDPEIKYIEAMAEFRRIKERQAILANYYNQINQP